MTVRDMTDVMFRAARRRRPRLGWRWRESFLGAALVTAICVTVIEVPVVAKIIASATTFVVIFAGLGYYFQWRVDAGLARYVAEKFGPSAPCPFEIDITSTAMTTRQLGEEVRREWSNVERVTEATGGIEIDIRLGGLVFVRDTGFKTLEERTEFLRLVKEYAPHAIRQRAIVQ